MLLIRNKLEILRENPDLDWWETEVNSIGQLTATPGLRFFEGP
jgi:hypothetical protein